MNRAKPLENRPIRVAMIGLGWVSTHRHLPVLRRDPRFEIIGVVDTNGARAEEVARRHRIPRHSASPDLSRVDWLKEADAVTVGTSPFSHYSVIRSALSLGKHVLTEKPFTLTPAEGEELVAQARRAGLILSLVHNFQFARSTRAFLREYQEGKFGRIKGLLAQQLCNHRRRLPTWYAELPLGLFYDEGPHFFCLLRALSPGPLRLLQASAFPSTRGTRTPATIQVQYASEPKGEPAIPANMYLNFESPVSEWHVTVFGEDRLGDIDLMRDIYLSLPNDGAHTTSTVLRTSWAASWQHWSQHLTSGAGHLSGKLMYGNEEVFSRFAEAVATGREPEGIGAADALAILKMQHEVLEKSR